LVELFTTSTASNFLDNGKSH